MEETLEIAPLDYCEFLRKYNISFTEKEIWAVSGKRPKKTQWPIFVSSVRKLMPDLLPVILTELIQRKMAFKMIRNSFLHTCLNAGRFGSANVGRVMVLYPESAEKAKELADLLVPLLRYFAGPQVDGCIQLSPVLFTCYEEKSIEINGKTKKIPVIPKKSEIPFDLSKVEIVRKKKKRITGRYYLRTQTIRNSAKGDIFKAICLGKSIFKTAIVKQGRLNTVDDLAGRTIRDRLLWQKKVLEDLHGVIHVPQIIDFFEENKDSYLVMECFKGLTLKKRVEGIYGGSKWTNLSDDNKIRLLTYYLKCLQIIDKIHRSGYVHRDIKHENFMISDRDEPCLLDFELSYSILQQLPSPPFSVLYAGYRIPHLNEEAGPAIVEDIYSCGGLLLYFLTSKHPKEFITESINETFARINLLDIPVEMIRLIMACISTDPLKRPRLEEIVGNIYRYSKMIGKIPDYSRENQMTNEVYGIRL